MRGPKVKRALAGGLLAASGAHAHYLPPCDFASLGAGLGRAERERESAELFALVKPLPPATDENYVTAFLARVERCANLPVGPGLQALLCYDDLLENIRQVSAGAEAAPVARLHVEQLKLSLGVSDDAELVARIATPRERVYRELLTSQVARVQTMLRSNELAPAGFAAIIAEFESPPLITSAAAKPLALALLREGQNRREYSQIKRLLRMHGQFFDQQTRRNAVVNSILGDLRGALAVAEHVPPVDGDEPLAITHIERLLELLGQHSRWLVAEGLSIDQGEGMVIAGQMDRITKKYIPELRHRYGRELLDLVHRGRFDDWQAQSAAPTFIAFMRQNWRPQFLPAELSAMLSEAIARPYARLYAESWEAALHSLEHGTQLRQSPAVVLARKRHMFTLGTQWVGATPSRLFAVDADDAADFYGAELWSRLQVIEREHRAMNAVTPK